MTFASQQQAWRRPPVDNVGYLDSGELMAKTDRELVALINGMRRTRYDPLDWRNGGGRWRDLLGLDLPPRGRVLDYGCGVGIESVELAVAGNTVIAADIVPENVALAVRVAALYGEQIHGLPIGPDQTVALPAGSVDVFHCNGVLHHCDRPELIVAEADRLLRFRGEVRLMVYSDIGWRRVTGTEPPADTPADPAFERFVRHFDGVGDYADWYDEAKIGATFGPAFVMERFGYLTPNKDYCAAVLRRS